MRATRWAGAALWALAVLVAAEPAWTQMSGNEVRDALRQLYEQELWGEAVLDGGLIRAIKVDSLAGDSVAVRAVSGPLQERSRVYALSDFQSLRKLGQHRIPLRRAPYRESRSLLAAMALEAVVPGGGYFYIGESRQGLALLAFTAAAVGTAQATQQDGKAGWLPIGAWIKVASLLHLFDEVRAMNAAHRHNLAVGLAPGSRPSLQVSLLF